MDQNELGQKTCQKMDACMAVIAELVKLMELHLTEVEQEFDAEGEKVGYVYG